MGSIRIPGNFFRGDLGGWGYPTWAAYVCLWDLYEYLETFFKWIWEAGGTLPGQPMYAYGNYRNTWTFFFFKGIWEAGGTLPGQPICLWDLYEYLETFFEGIWEAGGTLPGQPMYAYGI